MSENRITPAPRRGRLPAVATVALVVPLLALVTGCDDGDDNASPSYGSSYTSSYEPSYTPSYEASTDTDAGDSYTSSDPYTTDDPYATDDPYTSSEPTEDPSPYTSGTCLNGTLPDSTTAQAVDDIDEVDCSAADAHYRVVETIPLTSDMSRCESNAQTQYAFSSRYTMNGNVISEYVYCLIGLGAYAR
ncbi:hypothetical protein [Streptomyces sp. NPDC057694]|uniref:LppU/SCO3897 family protein n=1 Tax=Streptomyces sp. NPDC057694 TaxID=3346216 RepID=UPI0036B88294